MNETEYLFNNQANAEHLILALNEHSIKFESIDELKKVLFIQDDSAINNDENSK